MGHFQPSSQLITYGKICGKTIVFMHLACKASFSGQAFYKKQPSPVGRVKIGASPVNCRFHPFDTRITTIIKTLYGRKHPLQFQRLGHSAMAMDNMQVTDEEIAQERKRLEDEEEFLGKEELSDENEVANNTNSTLGSVGSEMHECWDLWQRIGIPVGKIAKQRNMTETGVFFCIFTCIQNNYTVDWYELCKEAQFTLEIAKRLIKATEKLVSKAKSDKMDSPVDALTLRQSLPPDVSEVHFGLFVTMLKRGLSFDSIKGVSVQTGGQNKWGNAYNDEEQFPLHVSESNFLKWLGQRKGATLVDIVLKYRECNDLELMRLIIKLEQNDKIFWRQGVFKIL